MHKVISSMFCTKPALGNAHAVRRGPRQTQAHAPCSSGIQNESGHRALALRPGAGVPAGRLGGPAGQSLLEVALILPFLLVLIFATVDIARALHLCYQLSRLSREGANLVARGEGITDRALAEVLEGLIASARPPLDIEPSGRIVVSILRAHGRDVRVIQQVSRGRLGARSLAGPVGEPLDEGRLASILNGERLQDGQTIAFVESFYAFGLITPVSRLGMEDLFGPGPIVFGSRAIFFIS